MQATIPHVSLIVGLTLAFAALPRSGFAQTTSADASRVNDQLMQLAIANLQAAAQQKAVETRAAWEAASRMAEQAAGVATARMQETAEALPRLMQRALTEAHTLPTVNQGFPVDWSLVDGVSTAVETRLEGSLRRYMFSQIAVVPTPDGGAFVQLSVQADVQARTGLRWQTVGKEVLDGRHDLGTGVTFLSSTRTPMRADVPPVYESMALVGEHGWIASMQRTAEPRIPIGTVPSPALDHFVAALSGTLPDTMRIWVLDWTTGLTVPADLSFKSSGPATIPEAAAGEPCRPDVAINRVKRDVTAYRVRIGTKEEERRYLSGSPHVRISTDTRCVDLIR